MKNIRAIEEAIKSIYFFQINILLVYNKLKYAALLVNQSYPVLKNISMAEEKLTASLIRVKNQPTERFSREILVSKLDWILHRAFQFLSTLCLNWKLKIVLVSLETSVASSFLTFFST